MKVGDIVKAMGTRDLMVRLGIIVRQLKDLPIGLQVYEVMREDGTIETYTSAALRGINENR